MLSDVTACTHPSKDQQEAISIINIVVSILSLIGSFLTIISYLVKLYKEKKVLNQQRQIERQSIVGRRFDRSVDIRTSSNNSYSDYVLQPTNKPESSKLPLLIFLLSICDFLTSLFIITSQSTLLNNFSLYVKQTIIHGWIYSPCVLFRIFIQYFFLSTFFWTACISYYLYHQLSTPDEKPHLMLIFGSISFGIPMIITLPLALTNTIKEDPQTGWCEVSKVFELTLWFAPLVVCLVTCLFYYIRLRRLFRKKFEYRLNVNDRLRQIDGIISRRLTLYILVFIITWFPDIIQHIISFFSENCTIYPLMVLSNILTPSQGFWNFIIYNLVSLSSGNNSGTKDENKRLLI